jgi:hypothetical protein
VRDTNSGFKQDIKRVRLGAVAYNINIWCQRLLKHAKVLPSYLEESKKEKQIYGEEEIHIVKRRYNAIVRSS